MGPRHQLAPLVQGRHSDTGQPALPGQKQKKMAERCGSSPNTAKALGRAAAQEVSRQIDAGILTEEAVDVD